MKKWILSILILGLAILGLASTVKKEYKYADVTPGIAEVVDTTRLDGTAIDTLILSDSLARKYNIYGCKFKLITNTMNLANACTLQIRGITDGATFTDSIIHSTSGTITSDSTNYHSVNWIKVLGSSSTDSVYITAEATNIEFANSLLLQFLRSDIADTGKWVLFDSLTTKYDLRINGHDVYFGTYSRIQGNYTNALEFSRPGIASTMHYMFFADSSDETKHRSYSALMLIYGAGGSDTCLSLTHTGTVGQITTRTGNLELDAVTGNVKILNWLAGTSKLRGTTTFAAGTKRKAIGITGLTNAFICGASWVGDTTTTTGLSASGIFTSCKADSLIVCIQPADTLLAQTNGINYWIMK